CSLDRFVPLYKALKQQKAKRHETFLSRQRLFSETKQVSEEEKQKVVEALKKQRYNIQNENGHILAEKGRFSRWGPYVNHIGLIIILLAALLRFTPFLYLDEYVWVREGEEKVIPETDGEYYIKNKAFTLDTYDIDDVENERFKEAIKKEGEPIAENYESDVVIYQAEKSAVTGAEPELKKIIEDNITVNNPLKFSGFTLYQAGYQLNEFKTMSFNVHEKNDPEEKALGTFTIDLMSPEREYKLDNGFRVKVENYYPDYYLDNGEPRSESKYPRNPAFVLWVYPPGSEERELSFI